MVPFDDAYNLLLANILFNRISYPVDFNLERVAQEIERVMESMGLWVAG